MTNDSYSSWGDMDTFQSEVENFDRDVHLLILGTLHAGINYLNDEAQKESDKLAPHFETVTGDDHDRLVEMDQQIWMYVGDQERFLRNIALSMRATSIVRVERLRK
jgi:hypothetical protein